MPKYTPAPPLRGAALADDLHQALSDHLPATRFLRTLQEPALQQAVGALLADYLRADAEASPFGPAPGSFATRGAGGAAFVRLLGHVDAFAGRLGADLAGRANQWMRAALADPIALTLGDVVAYHQRRAEIHQRLFDALAEHAPGFGGAERPITVLAHSLGGLLSFDAALPPAGPGPQLHIKRWITFGSQPAFFHVMAPRAGLAPYVAGTPVRLPPSIGAWTNLWHPLDPLAFAAARIFTLSDGRAPLDLRVDTPATEIAARAGWLHSAYWDNPLLAQALASGAAPR